MAQSKSRSWKLERASVSRKGGSRARSNKYRASDSKSRPESRSRQRVWIGGYDKSDGTHVAGHYRTIARKMKAMMM